MRNYRIVLLFIVLSISTIPLSSEELLSKYFTLDTNDWVIIDTSKTRYTPESLLAECDNYYSEISEYLFGKVPEITTDKMIGGIKFEVREEDRKMPLSESGSLMTSWADYSAC